MLRFLPMRHLISSVVLAFAAVLSGCDDHGHHRTHRNDPDVDKEPGAFFYRVEADDFTETRTYSWDTFEDEVFVTFEAFDFRGQFGIRIVDDHGITIYDRHNDLRPHLHRHGRAARVPRGRHLERR
jgi:hypothetical protein